MVVWILTTFSFPYLLLFFFLPFTCFSKLLSLWLIFEAEDIFRSGSFTDSVGTAVGSCLTIVGSFSAENAEKEGCGALVGCATGISGIPKNFFTPWHLSTAKFKNSHMIQEKSEQKTSLTSMSSSSFNFQSSKAEIKMHIAHNQKCI